MLAILKNVMVKNSPYIGGFIHGFKVIYTILLSLNYKTSVYIMNNVLDW